MSYEDDREDFAVGERFAEEQDANLEPIVLADRESTEAETLEAIAIGAEQECPECGHELSLHDDPYGCQYERGDAWVTGNQAGEPTVLMAQGPCGCKYNAQRETRDELDKALRDYAASVKKFGKALVDLGRACDGKEAA